MSDNNKTTDKTKAPSLTSSIGGVPLAKAAASVFVFYALALALNGTQLHRNNELLPYGGVRTFWVKVTTPINTVCSRLHLDAPRHYMQSHWGARLNGGQ